MRRSGPADLRRAGAPGRRVVRPGGVDGRRHRGGVLKPVGRGAAPPAPTGLQSAAPALVGAPGDWGGTVTGHEVRRGGTVAGPRESGGVLKGCVAILSSEQPTSGAQESPGCSRGSPASPLRLAVLQRPLVLQSFSACACPLSKPWSHMGSPGLFARFGFVQFLMAKL